MTEVQTAWVAGIIEGEGCISISWHGAWKRVLVSVNMTDFDVIDRLKAWSGYGSIGVNKPIQNRKQSWTWTVAKEIDVQALLNEVFPFLGKRRQAKAYDALETLKEKAAHGGLGRGRHHRAKTSCRNGHLLDEANCYVSKRGTRTCRTCRRESVQRWVMKDPDRAREIHREAIRRFRDKKRLT